MSPELEDFAYLISIYVMERISAKPARGVGFAHATSVQHAAQFEKKFMNDLKSSLSSVPEEERKYDVVLATAREMTYGDNFKPDQDKIIVDLLPRIGVFQQEDKSLNPVRPTLKDDPYAGLDVLTPFE